MENLNGIEEPATNWRSMAGYVYIIICLFDFLVMPVIIQADNQHTKNVIVKLIDAEDYDVALKLTDKVNADAWEPVTLYGGGLFHISFGAILTGAAVTRGFERREIVRQNGKGKGQGNG